MYKRQDEDELPKLTIEINDIEFKIKEEYEKRLVSSSDRKDANKLVKRAIGRAYNNLRPIIPELVDYLEITIETRRRFSYNPHNSIKYLPVESEDWILY